MSWPATPIISFIHSLLLILATCHFLCTWHLHIWFNEKIHITKAMFCLTVPLPENVARANASKYPCKDTNRPPHSKTNYLTSKWDAMRCDAILWCHKRKNTSKQLLIYRKLILISIIFIAHDRSMKWIQNCSLSRINFLKHTFRGL